MDTQTRDRVRHFLFAANALLDSMASSLAASSGTVWKHSSYKIYMRKYCDLLSEIQKVMPVSTICDIYDLTKVPGSCDTIATQQKDLFDSVHANLSILRAYLENILGVKGDEVVNLANFFQANLRRAIFAVPQKEMEIQNAIEQLLIGRGMAKGIDYDRECGRVKVSIKEVIPDFIFQRLGLALEVKLSKDKSKSKEIVDEINADIMAYGTKYAFIVFVVYDLGTIRDEVEFKHDLELSEGVSVIVVKH